LALWGLWGALPSLQYWLSKAPAVDIGKLGAYRPEAAPEGAAVIVEGIASPKRGAYARLWRDHEVFPLVRSRVLIDRPRAPDASLEGYGFRYRNAGRIHRVDDDAKWDAVRQKFADLGELPREGPIYVIDDGDVPGAGVRTPLEGAFWTLLLGVSGTMLALRLLTRREATGERRKASP
jgi:hypothetical protein